MRFPFLRARGKRHLAPGADGLRTLLAARWAWPHTGSVCTLILLHRPGADFPLLVAANRDEMLARPWRPPAEHWPELPGVVGGLDVLAGGTWLALNAAGVVAGVLNRSGSLGPAAGKRTRGGLPLMALRHTAAATAAAALAGLDAGDWRSFNMVIADEADAFIVRGLGAGAMSVARLPRGISMVTASDPNDMTHPRVARHLPRFQAAAAPVPPQWGAWPELLADSEGPFETQLCVRETNGFGTISSMLIAGQLWAWKDCQKKEGWVGRAAPPHLIQDGPPVAPEDGCIGDARPCSAGGFGGDGFVPPNLPFSS